MSHTDPLFDMPTCEFFSPDEAVETANHLAAVKNVSHFAAFNHITEKYEVRPVGAKLPDYLYGINLSLIHYALRVN
jgi:hypothetical protein